MNVTENDRQKLKKYGFQWFKNNCTDRVEASDIADIVPAANGFTVIYNHCKDDVVLAFSTAKVEKIEYPDDLDKQWIRVHWNEIEDVNLERTV